MANFFRRWILGYDNINIDGIITNAMPGRKKKPIQHAILDSLKNNIDEWKFVKGKYSSDKHLSSYMFVNKENHISFKCRSHSMGIEFTDPISFKIVNDDSSKLYEYINGVWDCNMSDVAEFVYEHVNADHGFHYIAIIKEKINLLEFKFWCMNNCEGKYYIDSNDFPNTPDYIDSYDKKKMASKTS